MRWYWQTKANVIANALRFQPTFRKGFIKKRFGAVATNQASYDASIAPFPVGKPLPAQFTHPTGTSQFTSSQISLASSQAIHLSVRSSDLKGAYAIFNTVHDSQPFGRLGIRTYMSDRKVLLKGSHLDLQLPTFLESRLVCHSLLHSLLRKGYIGRAHSVCNWMMQNYIPIHHTTLETVVNAYAAANPSTFVEEHKILLDALRTPEVLRPKPHNKNLECIMQLLQAAEQYKQRRTDRMFSAFIKSAILQGEIILATFIFAAVVHCWEVRDTVQNEVQALAVSGADLTGDEPQALVRAYRHLRKISTFPLSVDMQCILQSINSRLKETKQDDLSQLASLQALANLAVLLDRRQLPFSDVAPLLKSLYNCPNLPHKVWIMDKDGNPDHVNTYEYIQDVLNRLVNSLPHRLSIDPTKTPDAVRHVLQNTSAPSARDPVDYVLPAHECTFSMLPDLDMHSCNSLLKYVLQRKRSTSKATKILNYLDRRRSPDITTYNILVRYGVKIRRPDISRKALLILQEHKNRELLGISSCAGSTVVLERPLNTGPTFASSATPLEFSGAWGDELKATDIYTLTSTIVAMTETRNIGGIVEIMHKLFPRLSDHDTTQESYVRRGVLYGPHLFTVLIVGLMRGYKVGLAERVWSLARNSERASWVENYNLMRKPWRLPVHAYTAMIRGYAGEAFYKGRNPFVKGWGRRRRAGKAKELARTWLGKTSAFLLYQDMIGQRTRCEFEELESKAMRTTTMQLPESVMHPQPDGKLFGTLLKALVPGKLLGNHVDWLELLREELRTGDRPVAIARPEDPFHTQSVRTVAYDMLKAGFGVPPGVQYFLRKETSQM